MQLTGWLQTGPAKLLQKCSLATSQKPKIVGDDDRKWKCSQETKLSSIRVVFLLQWDGNGVQLSGVGVSVQVDIKSPLTVVGVIVKQTQIG